MDTQGVCGRFGGGSARNRHQYGRSRQKSALYADLAKPAIGAAFRQVLNFQSGDVVQLVRTLPCHGFSLF
jgi:hypothetical protein